MADLGPDLKARFTPNQLELLEKLNRVDVTHMRRLEHVVVPSTWQDELEHSPFPKTGQWRLNWYFTFFNARGLAFHQFELPGLPASHACVRLLERDAMWIYQWGQSWTLDAKGQLLQNGTPVLIVGAYAFGAPPPWLSVEQLARPIVLPDALPAQ